MKKVFKAFIAFAILIYPFAYISNLFFYNIFSFSIFSAKDWQTISAFWNSGGSISTAKDYYFIALIAFTPILYILMWRLLYKKSFSAVLLYPLHKYNSLKAKMYDKAQERIILKNIGRSQSRKEMLADLKPDLDASKQTSQTIREAVREKLTNN